MTPCRRSPESPDYPLLPAPADAILVLPSDGRPVNINLATLKSEILRYLESSDFAVFHSNVGGLDGHATIAWDSEAWPDYRTFLDTARKAGARLILFASREITEEEITEASEDIDTLQIPRDDRRELESRFRAARKHIGETCTLELAFSQGSWMYVYEVRPDWYDEFLDAVDELDTLFPGEDESSSDGLGGYYSNN
jgi:hypothetical protein